MQGEVNRSVYLPSDWAEDAREGEDWMLYFFRTALESLLAVATHIPAGHTSRLWIWGEINDGELFRAAIACVGERVPCQFYMPPVISDCDQGQLLEHWFTTRMPSDERFDRLVSDDSWLGFGTLFMAAILPVEVDALVCRTKIQDAKKIILRRPRDVLIVKGYRDNDVADVIGDERLVDHYIREAWDRGLVPDGVVSGDEDDDCEGQEGSCGN